MTVHPPRFRLHHHPNRTAVDRAEDGDAPGPIALHDVRMRVPVRISIAGADKSDLGLHGIEKGG